MILSDRDIRAAIADGRIVLDPFDDNAVQPASVDVTLHPVLRVPLQGLRIDLADVPAGHTREHRIGPDGYVLPPGGFVLGATNERLGVRDLVSRVEGRSSLGRLALAVHITAGFVDPGFGPAQITMEIANFGPWEIVLRENMSIGQLAFETISSSPDRDYSVTGRYSTQEGATESRYGWSRERVLEERSRAHLPAAAGPR